MLAPFVCRSLRMARFLCLLPAAASSFLSTGSADAGPYSGFGAWSVACSNGLTCAMSVQGETSSWLWSFGIERSAQPADQGHIIVWAAPGEWPGEGRLIFAVDGEVVARASLAADDGDGEEAGRPARLVPDEGVRALIDAMAAGSTLELSFEATGEGAREPVSVSLSGVSASTLFIDETQDRLDRQDAWRAVGEGPTPSGEGATRDIDSIDQLSPAVRADFAGDGLCASLDPSDLAEMTINGGFRITLSEYRILVGLPCGQGGAYNQPFAFYAGANEASLRPLSLPEMTDTGPTTTPMAYNVSYDPVSDRISAFFRARGLGDCGTYTTWQVGDPAYPDMTGLTLIETRAKGDCDGDYAGGPENWPLIWPDGE